MSVIRRVLIITLSLSGIWGCGSEDEDDPTPTQEATATTETDADTATTESSTVPASPTEGPLTLANCDMSFGDGLPAFYSTYFACVDATAADGSVSITTDGLPPHPSPYYAADDPNYVEFDDRGGTHFKNPNSIGAVNYTMNVPNDPIPKGITIDASNVDNTMNTSDDEYGGGPVGVALNGVTIFAAMAAPGDNLADEQFTFDLYEGHPAGTTYHYHFETRGPLEVLVERGLSDDAEPGEGNLELYGMMCDGTVVLGCTELDGSLPSDAGFDSQNGHVHDLGDDNSTFFSNRYHTHVCPDRWPNYPFFPEIAYYETSSCGGQGQSAGQGPRPRP